MAFNKKAGVVAFTVALLLVAYCTEAVKICSQKSQTFRGNCVSNKFCASTCVHEEGGYTGGYCSRRKHAVTFWSAKRICKCTKKCGGEGEEPSPPGGEEPSPPGGEEPSPPGEAPAVVSGTKWSN